MSKLNSLSKIWTCPGFGKAQNYNLQKSEDSRSPEALKEKEEAIIEAFKAFQMI